MIEDPEIPEKRRNVDLALRIQGRTASHFIPRANGRQGEWFEGHWEMAQEMGRRAVEVALRRNLLSEAGADLIEAAMPLVSPEVLRTMQSRDLDENLKGFQAALPQAAVHAFEDAGHYVLEDKHEVLVPEIRAFLDRNPL